MFFINQQFLMGLTQGWQGMSSIDLSTIASNFGELLQNSREPTNEKLYKIS